MEAIKQPSFKDQAIEILNRLRDMIICLPAHQQVEIYNPKEVHDAFARAPFYLVHQHEDDQALQITDAILTFIEKTDPEDRFIAQSVAIRTLGSMRNHNGGPGSDGLVSEIERNLEGVLPNLELLQSTIGKYT